MGRDRGDYERTHGYVLVRLHLLPTEEGGRSRPIWSDYRSSWDIGATYKGERTFNDAPLTLEDVERLEPGQTAIARLHPIAAEFWTHLKPGHEIYAHEGLRRVGVAEVIECRMTAHSVMPDQ